MQSSSTPPLKVGFKRPRLGEEDTNGKMLLGDHSYPDGDQPMLKTGEHPRRFKALLRVVGDVRGRQILQAAARQMDIRLPTNTESPQGGYRQRQPEALCPLGGGAHIVSGQFIQQVVFPIQHPHVRTEEYVL